jgi:prepilin-type N-terminal cleavage/methylation domain-containing protein
MPQARHESGFTLIETMIAMLVLTVGALGMAATFLQGMRLAGSSPAELVATQKAAEAIESVFSARDSHTVSWAQLRNRADGGIFENDATPILTAGEDGVVNTGDSGEVPETVELPGMDQNLATTEDNRIEDLSSFTREIDIEEISTVLRSITVTITYKAGGTTQTYRVVSYISSYA